MVILVVLVLLAGMPAAQAQSAQQFVEGPCPFSVPKGMQIRCGTLSVPEDWNRPDARQIRIAVAIVQGSSKARPADPVVYLSGGPGNAAMRRAPTLAKAWAGFLGGRDMIFVDQRGTGFSEPALVCDESIEAATTQYEHTPGPVERAKIEAAALLRCRDRFVKEGVTLAAYTTSSTAADFEALRQALGYKQWNLFGISYGSRLALAIVQEYPAGVRSIVLDSVYPPDMNLYISMPANLDRAADTLFAACAADRACNRAYPTLEATFYEVVAQLNAEPASIKVQDPNTGKTVTMSVDGTRLVDLLFRMLYDSAAIPQLPRMIANAKRGNYSELARLESIRLTRTQGIAHADYYAVQCNSDIAQFDTSAAAAATAPYPQLQGYYAGLLEFTPEVETICDRWGSPPPQERERAQVRSDIPALLLAGEYDPITPPAWAVHAATTLKNSSVYTFPATGHAVVGRGACPVRIIGAFLNRPDAAPDASCIKRMGGPAWLLR